MRSAVRDAVEFHRQVTDKREHDRLNSELLNRGRSADPFASAVRATRMPMLITDPHRRDNPIVFVNDAFTKLTGYSRDEVLGRNCRFLQGDETDPDHVAQIRSAIERRVPIEIEILNHKKNGEIFHNRVLISPVFDDDGVLTYFFASQFDVTLERDRLVRVQRDRDTLEGEISRRNDDLLNMESRLTFMSKAGRFGSWTLDLTDRRLVASDICKVNFGRSVDEPFTYDDLLASVHPEDQERMTAAVAASIDKHADYDIEYRVVVPHDEDRWVHVRGQPFYRADGTPLSMAGVSIDITERKRGEEHRALLAGELKHRVKNSMATMQSIAHQTLRSANSISEAKENLDSRLASLATAHDVLTRENWDGATLSEVVAGALSPFQSKHSACFTVGGPNVRISPKAALAFVMALHELATNAVKYGSLSKDAGRVIVAWEVLDRETFWFRWEELNGPPVIPPTHSGFGSRMIERMLAAEIKGTAELNYRPHGLVCIIEAPMTGVRENDPEMMNPRATY